MVKGWLGISSHCTCSTASYDKAFQKHRNKVFEDLNSRQIYERTVRQKVCKRIGWQELRSIGISIESPIDGRLRESWFVSLRGAPSCLPLVNISTNLMTFTNCDCYATNLLYWSKCRSSALSVLQLICWTSYYTMKFYVLHLTEASGCLTVSEVAQEYAGRTCLSIYVRLVISPTFWCKLTRPQCCRIRLAPLLKVWIVNLCQVTQILRDLRFWFMSVRGKRFLCCIAPEPATNLTTNAE